jgi:hypothetical protein
VGVREIGRVGFAAGETVVRVGELESLDQPRANMDQSSATGVSVLMGLAAKIIAGWMMPHV